MERKKIFLVIAVFAFISGAMIVLAIIFNAVNPGNTNESPFAADQRITVDPDSGETVVSPEGRVAESSVNNGVLLLGFSKLLNSGLSNVQLELTQNYITDYAITHKIGGAAITKVSLAAESISPRINSRTGQKDIYADIRINGDGVQRLKLSYISIKDLLLVITDKSTGKVLYRPPQDNH